jgi:hypothetical protein
MAVDVVVTPRGRDRLVARHESTPAELKRVGSVMKLKPELTRPIPQRLTVAVVVAEHPGQLHVQSAELTEYELRHEVTAVQNQVRTTTVKQVNDRPDLFKVVMRV